MSKLIVGQTVWLKAYPIGRPLKKCGIVESTILTVGRKYFTLDKTFGRRRYRIDNGKEDGEYNSYSTVYFDKQLLDDELEYDDKFNEIAPFFNTSLFGKQSKVTLPELRAIYDILFMPGNPGI